MYYEEFEIGDRRESKIARTISESEVYTQAGLESNYNPLHTNKEYMRDTEFGERIVQNTLLMTVMSGLANTIGWDPNTIAAYGRDGTRFINPVFIDDTVHLESEVIDKRSKGDDRGVITFERELFNQDDDKVAIDKFLRLIRKQP